MFKISTKISLLRQLSTYVPAQAQKLYYQGYILPLIDYGSITWGAAPSANIERLNKLQKRAARIILHADFTTPSPLLFKELGWLSVSDRFKYNKATMIYKALNNQTPEYISNLLKPMSEVICGQLKMAHYLYQDHIPRYMTAHSLVLHPACGILFLQLSKILVL